MNNILDLLITEASTIEYIDRRYLEESNKVLMGFRIKPQQNIDETFKKHSYQGYLDFIKNKADLSDIDYLRKDYQQGLATFKRIKERIEKVEKLGDCKETSGYYKGIKSKYIDKGITSKDVEATIKWFNDNIPKALNDRKAELSK